MLGDMFKKNNSTSIVAYKIALLYLRKIVLLKINKYIADNI
jgi:hypothetical protein